MMKFESAGCLLILALCLGAASPVLAQEKAVPPVATFDVVSIKPNKSGDGSISINQGSDRYAGKNVTLKIMLRFAYNLTTEDQISGLPGWAEGAHYDVEAKIDADAVAALKALPKEESGKQRRLLMQAMLADRFHLQLHHETKDLPIYTLVQAKGGTKLTPSQAAPYDPSAPRPAPGGKMGAGSMMVSNTELTAVGVPLTNLADFLAQVVHRQVKDQSGLTGVYDMKLTWARDEMGAGSHDGADNAAASSAPSLFTALQEQLGLRLESTRGPVDTIVIDHVEQPTEN